MSRRMVLFFHHPPFGRLLSLSTPTSSKGEKGRRTGPLACLLTTLSIHDGHGLTGDLTRLSFGVSETSGVFLRLATVHEDVVSVLSGEEGRLFEHACGRFSCKDHVGECGNQSPQVSTGGGKRPRKSQTL